MTLPEDLDPREAEPDGEQGLWELHVSTQGGLCARQIWARRPVPEPVLGQEPRQDPDRHVGACTQGRCCGAGPWAVAALEGSVMGPGFAVHLKRQAYG